MHYLLMLDVMCDVEHSPLVNDDLDGEIVHQRNTEADAFLAGIRVIEIADELGEYCGKVLSGLGADVIKVEPPEGERTRTYGPFLNDEPDPDRSLHFWHYNFGKRSIVLDLDLVEDAERFRALVKSADVLLDTRHRDYLDERGIGYEALKALNPRLVYCRISAFGDTGPWADYHASDLVHLALGGVMMNCGYDPAPTGEYDSAPVAPQMWQSYQITGEVTAVQILAALNYRFESGSGQKLTSSVHDAVSKTTETDLPDWVYSHRPHARLTGRHSFAKADDSVEGARLAATMVNPNARTKDGRWVLTYRTYLEGLQTSFERTVDVLEQYGAAEDLREARYAEGDVLSKPESIQHLQDVLGRLVGGFTYDKDLWRDGQARGLTWAPVRRPEENIGEEHWSKRETFVEVDHPEVGRSFTEIGAKWMAPGIPWRKGPRAPLLGEHTEELITEVGRVSAADVTSTLPRTRPARASSAPSRHGTPFALSGVRVIDLSWMLASAGAGRFFTAHGAEVIKVEHISRLDGMRMGMGVPPRGGRAERAAATGPLELDRRGSVNRSGSFGEINAGKRSLSLNLKHPRAKEILTDLIRDADIITEGFSPGTMDRMGFGYERLREINPRIIYVQQSGMGQIGSYGQLRSFGPTAQAFSGLTEMSGFPEPWSPAGIGFSYLDWFGAYQMSTAMMAALYRQNRTGLGCWIDSSQAETGIYLSGSAVLDYAANGRSWSRSGNRAPYTTAAPSGAFRTAGDDRWIAVSVVTDDHWRALSRVLGRSEWATDHEYSTVAGRKSHEASLEDLVGEEILRWDPFELMTALQEAGVPAGVCQTAQDRVESDPQLRHLEWLVELDHSEMGRWPVKEVPVQFSETPPFIGGRLDRHGPLYGEDTEYVLGEILGLSPATITELSKTGAI